MAYLISFQTDHLEVPAARSCTAKGTEIVLKPIQEESARKKGARSGMASSASTACRSRSLKSEAFDISTPAALLIMR